MEKDEIAPNTETFVVVVAIHPADVVITAVYIPALIKEQVGIEGDWIGDEKLFGPAQE